MATKHEQVKSRQTSNNVINFGATNFGIFEDQIFDYGDLTNEQNFIFSFDDPFDTWYLIFIHKLL